MYYPILRGRLNELLAIRELSKQGALDMIVPIIEPVNASSTLLVTLNQLNEQKRPYALIINPTVGTFCSELAQNPDYEKKFREAISSPQVVHCFYPTSNPTSLACLPAQPTAYFLDKKSVELYQAMVKAHIPSLTILPANSGRLKRLASGDAVALETEFEPQERNADYRDHEEDFLTEEHLHVYDEGYKGFSDHSLIGERFSTKGFMPRVVALHLPYFKHDDVKSDGPIWIRHFTSSEFDEKGKRFGERDIAGKFGDALKKLIAWIDEKQDSRLATTGIAEYRKLQIEGRYPGLGVAKKLSLMHHLEMVNKYLLERS